MSRRRLDIGELVGGAQQGQPRAVARLISLVEDSAPELRDVAAALAPHTG
ncbi:MAG: methylmalonyl Co-A mutase-associated GTPase MeaB, partial [Pseudonocardiaceae bacterium]